LKGREWFAAKDRGGAIIEPQDHEKEAGRSEKATLRSSKEGESEKTAPLQPLVKKNLGKKRVLEAWKKSHQDRRTVEQRTSLGNRPVKKRKVRTNNGEKGGGDSRFLPMFSVRKKRMLEGRGGGRGKWGKRTCRDTGALS